MQRVGTGVVTFLAVCAVAYLALACGMQRRVLYPRPSAGPQPVLPAGASLVRLGEHDEIEAFYLRPAETAAPFPVVLFAHGNGELIDYWLAPFRELPARGVGVLLVEYPGYGRSGGNPTQESVTRAVVAGFDFLAEQPDAAAERIVGYGRSLGGGAVCALAGQRPLAGLILESTFTSVTDMAARFAVPSPLVLDPFDNLAALGSLQGVPMLVIHGERDPVIPVRHGEALAAAAGVELVRLPCGHNDCPRPWSEIYAFLQASGILR